MNRTTAAAEAEIGGQVIAGPCKGGRGRDPGTPTWSRHTGMEIAALDVDATRGAS